MNPDEWQKLSPVLDQLLDLPEAQQAQYLQKLRMQDPRLCQEVESLLKRQHPTERLEAPPQWLQVLRPTAGDSATPLAARDQAASKPPRIAGAEAREALEGDDTLAPEAAGLLPPPSIPGYEILGELGRGGMGVVYKALQKSLKRVVALKMILADGTEELDRFRIEAEAVAALHHPNIVQIYEVGKHEGRPFFSLEYCPGGGLDRKLAGTPLPAAEAARLMETLARALHAAHQQRVVHRDLKPANVLLSADGAPKAADFGLAKRLDEVGRTHTGQVMGTPSYMAPEQASGGKAPVGPAADVYALGAILYECLTGRPPFKAATALDTLLQLREDDPVPPRRLQPRTPRDLETICLKCLQKDPEKRYGSAEALAEDLRRQQAGEPIAARPAGRLERTWRWCRRNPKDAMLIVAGLLAVVLGIVAYLWVAGVRQADERDRRDRQARVTTEAERNLAEAELLWDQAKIAPVGDLASWERALAAAGKAREVIDVNAVEDATRRRVEQTLTAVAARMDEAKAKADAAARDERMKAELENLAYSQLQLTTVHGQGFVVWPFIHDDEYKEVFHTYYDIDVNRSDDAEARIRASAIKPQLLAGLDAWIPLRWDVKDRRQVADLANRVSEPDDFRRELREALVAQDHDQLRQLAKRDLSKLPPRVLFDVALTLSNSQDFEAAVALLRPAQQRYPADHGISFQLAYCLGNLNPPQHDDEIRFYTAAVALQPNNSMYHNSLGNALWQREKLDEAVAEYRTANGLDPKNANALANLRNLLPQLGKVCLYTRRPAAAARLFKEAFTTMAPGQAENYRFEAAQAAAQAAVGKLPDAASLTEEERAGWRRQALDWLRADLQVWKAKAETGKREDRQAAAQQLRLWRVHVAFAALRDEAELKKLPQDEQTAWRQFWTDVAALVERAEKP